MKTLFFLLAVAFLSTAFAHFPQTVSLPKEDFKYSCTAHLSEQTSEKGRDCYSSANAEFELSKSDFQQYTGLFNATVDTKSLTWTKNHSWENCPEIPKSVSNKHMISFSFVEDGQQNKILSLHIRVLKDEDQEYMWASSDREELYSRGEVSTEASLHQNQKNPNVTARNVILTLKVSCQKSN